jgi:hypothetical protein
VHELFGDRRLGEPCQVEEIASVVPQHAASTVGPGLRPSA